MENKLVIGGIYRHFKGDCYKVLTLALDSETKEEMVVYIGLYAPKKEFNGQTVFIRSKEMFLSEVDHEKYPDVEQKFRFQLV